MHLYNTLTLHKETFIKKEWVTMYHCGPTVYDYAHIGNLRSYVFADILRRTFEYNSYKVHQVINITDIGHLVTDGDDGEDKMIKALKREGKPFTLEAMRDVATFYFEKFVDDLKSLNIKLPQEFPRASDHIEDDIDFIKILEQKGYTYPTEDGIYFDTAKFTPYGKLGKLKETALKIDDQTDIQSRVGWNSDKRSQRDFAVWKFDAKLGWESPWGKGLPGWHIECSVMSRKYLGQPFDIHTGGVDHIPIHHNNEIAQSESAYDGPLAHYWMHNEFVTLNNSKMSKSAGNFATLAELKEQFISPLAYRYWLLTAHYRSPANFTLEAVQGAQNALIRLISLIGNLPDDGFISTSYKENFQTYINNDLDTPKGIALVWDILRDKQLSDADKKATIINIDEVLGLNLIAAKGIAEETVKDVPADIAALVEAREQARAEKDWVKSDALRQEIEERGFVVTDTKDGIRVILK
ncbi:MAG: cysteine--tRNA ligase [Candidatus Taylorbacteria bacterium RIFCSPHIGHO2_12_FULL_45_16]|uniref:Cysteine--tRNA ligase n=1 Tax=Candidatus Taylorbacteria bacterium RIFCSPHIGHO2_12_FULL_45_16 TaxID=1802315 RepID=A0A1G2N283_9BACT|nr:MAG: cysteine--tRNA ligase [Candidatus Taylorbacteria bacterium RIFCSPHIGHO2_12_FULL_45_16]OHA33543.1 MAG: cysteine--tRNA ligase [Candidatus Taylorbacteria bacterium RIFCSPLOWO2_01_FULL_45_59]